MDAQLIPAELEPRAALGGMPPPAPLTMPPQDLSFQPQRRWLRGHWVLVVATTALWGVLMGWAVADPDLEGGRNAGLLATIGLATAFAHTFSMRLGFSALGIVTLYVPALALLLPRADLRADAIVMAVYGIYVVLSLLRSHADYQRRLDFDELDVEAPQLGGIASAQVGAQQIAALPAPNPSELRAVERVAEARRLGIDRHIHEPPDGR